MKLERVADLPAQWFFPLVEAFRRRSWLGGAGRDAEPVAEGARLRYRPSFRFVVCCRSPGKGCAVGRFGRVVGVALLVAFSLVAHAQSVLADPDESSVVRTAPGSSCVDAIEGLSMTTPVTITGFGYDTRIHVRCYHDDSWSRPPQTGDYGYFVYQPALAIAFCPPTNTTGCSMTAQWTTLVDSGGFYEGYVDICRCKSGSFEIAGDQAVFRTFGFGPTACNTAGTCTAGSVGWPAAHGDWGVECDGGRTSWAVWIDDPASTNWPPCRVGDAYSIPPTGCSAISVYADVLAADELVFFQAVTFTVEIPAGVTLEWLAFDFDGPTPLDTGAGKLGQAAYTMNEFAPNPLHLSSGYEPGLFFSYFILGDTDSTDIVGAETFNETIQFLGSTGGTLAETLTVECKIAGFDEGFGPYTGDWEGIDPGRACDLSWIMLSAETNISYGGSTDLDGWEFQITDRSGSEVEPDLLEWRWNVAADELTAWQTVPDVDGGASWPYTIIAFPAAIPGETVEAVSWDNLELRCTDAEGTVIVKDPATPGGSTGENDLESCYGSALGSMKLTSPRTWVTGSGRMGVCLVRALVVPSPGFVSGWADDQRGVLETTPPFSFGVMLLDFGSDLSAEVASPSGDGCFDVGIPVATVSSSDVCIGDGLSTTSPQRRVIALFIIVPMVLGLLSSGFLLLRGK